MKKIIVSAFVLGFSLSGISQEVEKEEKKVERITVVQGGEQTTTTPVSKSRRLQTPEEELKSCQAQLKAIQTKADYLKSHPEELKVAEENGWFVDAEKNKLILENRIKELKLQLKK